jgi:hypothetical protein
VRIVLAFILLCGLAMGQDVPCAQGATLVGKECINITSGGSLVTSSDHFLKIKPLATWTDRITKDGHYHSELDDPNNEWRCFIASTVEGRFEVTAFTVVCAKQREVKDERRAAEKEGRHD